MTATLQQTSIPLSQLFPGSSLNKLGFKGRSQNPKFYKDSMSQNWSFQMDANGTRQGWIQIQKALHGKGVDIFWNKHQY